MGKATFPQLIRLYRETGKCLELRQMELPFDSAQDFLSRLIDGGENPEKIKNELLEMGAVLKKNSTYKKPSKLKKVEKTGDKYQKIFDEAHKAGMEAGEKHVPTPMVVERHLNPMDDSSPVIERYEPVYSGVCGFAWVRFAGNTGFGRWAKKHNKAQKSYRGGLMIHVHEFGQSMEKKMKYAAAFATKLCENGIEAWMESRED